MAPKIEDYALVTDEHGQVLFVDGALPRYQSDTTHFWQSAAEINMALQAQAGIPAFVIRCLHHHYENGIITNYYLMALRDTPPAGGRWRDWTAALPLLPLPAPVIEGMHWRDQVHPLRVPWYSPDWFPDVDTRLHRLFDDITGPIAQLRSWQRSSVLRVPTAAGDIYVKAIPAIFAHEHPLTHWLSERFPDNIPLALRPSAAGLENLLLLRDYGGRPLSQVEDVIIWEAALRRYAEMQIQLTDSIAELAALGCHWRDLRWLKQGIEPLLTDPRVLHHVHAPLSAQEIESLQAAIPHLQAQCDALMALDMPLTLEHGDLWSGQIIVQDSGQCVMTDWSDSAITHPFFSLPFFLAEIEVEGAEDRLTTAYLDPWARHLSASVLRQALVLVRVLSPLYSAMVYHRHILPGMEIQWEMERMVVYNLRLLLSALASDKK